MGNMKFVAELMKLTSDVEERKAGLLLAKSIGDMAILQAPEAKTLLRKLAGGKPTCFDSAECITDAEMNLMLTIVSLNGSKAPQVQELLGRAEASDVEQTMTPPARVVSPAGATALPGMGGTIKPVKAKPMVRVKHDTLVNKVRLWLLGVPKGAIVTSKQIKTAFNIGDGTACTIVDSLIKDHAIRRKRDITGKFKRGTYVRMGKSSDATLKRRLRGKRVK